MRKFSVLFYALFLNVLFSTAQPTTCRKLTDETKEWYERLWNAGRLKQPYYSQFDEYPVRKTNELNSKYKEKTNYDVCVYGLDFYYASGTWFPKTMTERNRRNMIRVVKEAWTKHKAIPCFSWHLENPYTPSFFHNYMGCRFRYSEQGYPEEHRFVIHEILNNKGEKCGYGSFTGKDNPKWSSSPTKWFDSRCREVASIIKEFTDENGIPIPIIFRLWHECDGDWQWWGKGSVSIEDYKKFFRLTIKKIEKYTGTHNILYAFGLDKSWNTEREFIERWPGDKYVDLAGFDDYSIGSSDSALIATILRAKIVSELMKKKGKVAALFETDNHNQKTSGVFFKDFITPLIKDDGVHLGLIQVWSTDKLNSHDEINDRISFMRNGTVKMFNNDRTEE